MYVMLLKTYVLLHLEKKTLRQGAELKSNRATNDKSMLTCFDRHINIYTVYGVKLSQKAFFREQKNPQ